MELSNKEELANMKTDLLERERNLAVNKIEDLNKYVGLIDIELTKRTL